METLGKIEDEKTWMVGWVSYLV